MHDRPRRRKYPKTFIRRACRARPSLARSPRVLGDERYVPPDHPDSNQGMARRAWLDKVAIPPINIHPIPTDEADPAAAASKHETQLEEFFQLQPGEIPTFDIILLGMGDDGHTASLFPHTEALGSMSVWLLWVIRMVSRD